MLKIYVETDPKEGAVSVSSAKKEESASENPVAMTEKTVKAKPHGKFLSQENLQDSVPEAPSKPASALFDPESKECDSPEFSRKIPEKRSGEKVEQSVPLRATSGGAYIYPDGTVEFGMGGEAVLLPDGKTVSCTLSYRGFPSVAAADTVLTEGKWYYEVMILTDGLMQIGWCDTKFEGSSNVGEGVGDDTHSIAYDGKRRLKWHNGRSKPFGDRWKAGDVVCCAANLDDGVVKFALNGNWSHRSTAFRGLIFHDGLMPAASFSKGEKLCFNFGSGSNGFAYGPPNDDYLPVCIAQGNVSTIKKAKQVVEKQQERKRVDVVGNTTATSAPPLNATDAKRGTTSKKQDCTAKEQFIALLLKEDVRTAISRFLANPQVALMVQHLIVAVLLGSNECIQAQLT